MLKKGKITETQTTFSTFSKHRHPSFQMKLNTIEFLPCTAVYRWIQKGLWREIKKNMRKLFLEV